MHTLKPGWKMVKFGDVVRQCKEKVDRSNNPFQRYIEGGHIDSEDIHIRRWGEFGSDYVGPAFHRIFRKGQVLYGSRRTYLKKVAVADFDGITANTTFVCETKDQNIFMQELLPFLMLTESFTNHSIRESKGSTNPYINWSDIAKYEFPLPPLEEQKRLTELLWAADDAVNKFSFCKEQLSKFIAIYIENVKNEFPNIPWKMKKLGDIAKVERGKFSHRPRNLPQFYGGPYPFAQTGDIRKSNGEITKFEYTLTDEGVKYSKSFPAGTILITIAAVIGATAITTRETWATDSVVGIIPQKNIDTYFLEYILRTKRNYLENIAATQTAQKNINLQILRPLEIIIPPMEIQKIIVKEIDNFKNKLLDIDSHICRYQTLINALSNTFEREYV